VVDSLIPAGAEALRTLQPGDRIASIAGMPVTSWNDVMGQLQNAPGDVIPMSLEDGRTLELSVHSDALRERLYVSQAIQPWRPAVVDSVGPNTAASRAGLQPGDSLLALDGRPITQWQDFQNLVQERPKQPITMLVARGGQRVELRTTTDTAVVPAGGDSTRTIGFLGIGGRLDVRTEEYSLGQALAAGWRQTAESSTQIFRTVRGLFSGRVAGRELGGPILIGQLAGQATRLGLDALLGFMALISVNLAILNLLPIPVLDGGQFLFLLAEGVLRRPLSLKLRERLTAVGLVLILLLMVFAFSNDIRRVIE
jgi:regulator of sigma E protease